MSRRPQVLKITDSATTAFRRRDGNKHDELQHDSTGLRQQESHAKSSPPASEDGTPKTTRNLRSIFDGGREMVSSPRQIRKEDKTAGMLPAPGVTCEAAAGNTKPMLIATLSMEEAGDTLQKLSIRNENNLSPDPQTSTAFRAFSCNGHETLSTITKSVPDHAEATQHKTDKKETLHAGLLKERDSKAAAFDGLLQYLQDYRHGLRELLVNNNVVIIEPVRQSRVRLENRKYSATKSASEGTCRITGATVKTGNSTSAASNTLPRQQPILRRHFFYHPIRTNRSLVDEELPDPEKVRHAREIFERTIKMKDSHHEQTSTANDTKSTRNSRSSAAKVISASKTDNRNAADKVKRKYLTVDTVFRHNALHKRWTDSGSLSSGISSDLSCYETDVESPDTSSRKEEQTDVFSSDDEYPDRNDYLEESDEGHYVAPEVLERIRACGTTVTYYGGRVIAASNGPLRSPMTLAIMDEIEKNQKFTRKGTRIIPDEYLGVKFRLVKSNSCGSRLELAGTEEDEDWKAIAEEEHDAPSAQKSGDGPKLSDRTESIAKGKAQGHAKGAKSSRTGCLDSVLSTETEGRSTHGQTDMCEGCIRGATTKIWFSPEKAEVVERGSRNVLFNDIEFEEFEIAEDSLDVIQENDIECSKTDEDDAEQMHPRDCQPVSNHINVPGPATEKQSNEARNSTSKANGDVQMTTWASRSVLFDFRNCETEDSHLPTRKTEPNHSSC
ncbi:hypothetical protein B7P43_G16300 [Cryptotermes secundus]|uniref:Uncharacterized protein n=2 Tax=Cryptotermes secundus TaxID=105785 RepID=A0A2J7PPM6_9NEOP|nr:hypothetical protein B7P43_G16300 [Cryptotermes secundus]